MRILIFVLLATISVSNGYKIVGETSPTTSNAHILDGTFLTQLDHFRPQLNDTISFNYQVNLEHYQPGGPLYIYINDAREVASTRIESGLMVDIAEETNGALFTFNQRFFGDNRPTENTSFENLQFMTVEQSLADIALFIRFIRNSLEVEWETNVILWGSGYGGTMATWARKKYPHLVDACWSSSGVFLMDLFSPDQYDFLGYIVSFVGSYDCSDKLQEAFNQIDSLVQAGEGAQLQELFNLCHPVDTDSFLDSASFNEDHFNDVIVFFNRYHYSSDLLAYSNADLVRNFGSLDQVITRAIYTNGGVDPWLYTGITASTNPNTFAATIASYSRLADLTSIDPAVDSERLIEVKEQIRDLIIEWSFD